jgi:diaminopimelate epimerase
MVNIPFVKMVGAGNDFIIIEPRKNFDYEKFTKSVCHRQNGIGADGVLILEKSKKSDHRMRIINADGSEAEMCGNGARCMAAYITANAKPAKTSFGMETLAGEIKALVKGETVHVQLSNPTDYRPDLDITVDDKKFKVHYIDTGVPHTIVLVNELQKVDVNSLGAKIRHHKQFAPRGTNVNFVEPGRGNLAAVRTFERGVEAETLACGTGAVASALVAYLQANPKVKKQKGASMKVLTASREILEITFDLNEGYKIDNVWLKGSAKLIAKGEYCYNG